VSFPSHSAEMVIDMTTLGRSRFVLMVGGARAAYHVGFCAGVAGVTPDLRLPDATGVSPLHHAAFLAAQPGPLSPHGRRISHPIWANLTIEQVFPPGAGIAPE